MATFEGGVVTAGFGLSTWLLRVRRGTLGAVGLALVVAITLYFMLGAALTHIAAGSALSWVLTSSMLAAVSFLALLSGAGFLVRRDISSRLGPRMVVGLSGMLFVGLVAAGALAAEAGEINGDIYLISENVCFL